MAEQYFVMITDHTIIGADEEREGPFDAHDHAVNWIEGMAEKYVEWLDEQYQKWLEEQEEPASDGGDGPYFRWEQAGHHLAVYDGTGELAATYTIEEEEMERD